MREKMMAAKHAFFFFKEDIEVRKELSIHDTLEG